MNTAFEESPRLNRDASCANNMQDGKREKAQRRPDTGRDSGEIFMSSIKK
jgi:hypothetical protein